MTARRWSLLVVAAALSVVVVWPGLARAAAEPTRLVMQPPVKLPVSTTNPESVMVLGATLTSGAGTPVASQRVEFLMATDILGQKQAFIGVAVTDSGGSARTTFVVTRTGSYEFSARFAGNDALAASEAPVLKADLEALAGAAVPHQQLQLNRIGRWVPWAGLSLGVGVWITLIYVMARVLVVVPRAARQETRRG